MPKRPIAPQWRSMERGGDTVISLTEKQRW
jgi:hypothetical protein